MNVQTKRWARPLALFIALTMVMMYSFGGVVFATINDVQVKYPEGSKTDYFVVTTTIDGKTYVATAPNTEGANYEANFSPSLPDGFKSKLDKANTTILLNGTTQMSISNISASGSDQGDNSINITLNGPLVINPAYDLSINKTVNGSENASVPIGEIASFVIHVTNVGPDNATGVLVEDIVPVGLEFGNVKEGKGTYSTATGIWNIGDLGKNESVALTINVSSSGADEFRNTAKINFSPNYDTNSQNNEDSATLTVYDPSTPIKDLQILKVVDKKIVTIGEMVVFTIEAKNIRNTAMDWVVVNDNVPAGLSVSAVDFTLGTTFSGITWEVGTLNAGEAKYLTITAVTTTTGSITNTATGTAIGDNTPDNNFDSDTVQVNPKTQSPDPFKDLEITKTVNQASQASVTVGTGVTFTITVTNIGDTTMEAVEVKETWDPGLTQGTANATEGTTFSGTTWEIGTLGPDESRILTIAAGTPTAGTYTNNVGIFKSGEVSSPLVDDNLNNNTAAAIVTVTNPGTTGGGGGGGGGGGNTTSTITPNPVPTTNIPEEETPLVEAPEVTLEEQPIPLADVPQTGDNTNIWLLLALMMGSGAGIVLLGRRKETVEK